MCTKLHVYRINTATKSHPQSPLRSSPQHYLIQYQSLSLNLARAHTRPTQQKQSRLSLPRRPPREQGRNALRASAPRARCQRVFPPRGTPAAPRFRRPVTRLSRGALTKSCLLPDPSNEKKAKSQPFASILHTFEERLVANDPQNCFHRGVQGRAETAPVTEAGAL